MSVKKGIGKKSPVLTALATKVRNRRYELNISQEALAERCDFHVNYIGGIERGLRNPSLTSLVSLAKGLEILLKDLLPDT